MRNNAVFLATAAALILVAACNRGEDAAPTSDNQAEAADNVANGTASTEDHAAIMKARHDHYEEMGDAMKAIGVQLKADSPSLPTIQQHAATMARYAPQVLTWFPEGSGPESGRETRAKAEIWSDPETFRQRAQAFEAEAQRFNATVQSGDVAAIRAGQKALGDTCKNCHDRFRAPED
ncbi:MAG TPA: cytochrome c [Allosphingosinicella sp.]|nr:cytochrome c [Allosphingosinicella sp.]